MRLSLLFAMAFCALQLAAGEVKITVLSDLHLSPGNGNDTRIAQAVTEVNANDSDLVVVTGDITNRGTNAELENVRERLSLIKKPFFVIPGNHETNWSDNAALTFSKLWGDEKFAVTQNGTVLIGFSTGPYLKMGDGYVRSEDVAFLKKSLETMAANREPVIIFCHYPLATELGNGPAIAELLKKYNVISVISGHTHRQARREIYGLDSIVARPFSTGKTFGYNLLRFDGDKTLEVVEKRLGDETQYPVERLEPIVFHPFPPENPLPEGVEVRLLHSDRATIYTGVMAADNLLCYGTSDGRLVGLHLDGRPMWEQEYKTPFYSTPVFYDSTIAIGTTEGILFTSKFGSPAGSHGFSPTSQAVIGSGVQSEGNFYIGDGAGKFYRFHSSREKPISNTTDVNGTIQGRPAVSDGLVVFGAWDTHLYALDAKTLALRWKWSNGKSQVLYSPGNIVPAIGNGQVVIVAPDRFMTALDLQTGKQIWRNNAYKIRESLGVSEDGNTAYAKTMDGKLVAVKTGEVNFTLKWLCDLNFGYEHAPCPILESDGVVYAGSRNGVIAAVDARDGTLLWRFRGGDSAVNEFTRGEDDSVYATLIEGKIYRIRMPSRTTPRQIRIASLSPNLTEMVVALGAGQQLVGRSSACDYPESVKSLPVVGSLGRPSPEALLLARADIVVAESLRSPEDAATLRALNIRVELFPAARLDDYFRNLLRLGTLLGRAQEAQRAKEKFDSEPTGTDANNQGVLVVIASSPVITAGKNSFLTDIIHAAGGRNVAAGEDKDYFNCSMEEIAIWNPDWILAPGLPPEQRKELEKSPAWAGLAAVKGNRLITDFNSDLLYRLGPRTIDGIRQLRERLNTPR